LEKFDDMYIHLNAVPQPDGRTDGRKRDRQYRARNACWCWRARRTESIASHDPVSKGVGPSAPKVSEHPTPSVNNRTVVQLPLATSHPRSRRECRAVEVGFKNLFLKIF